MNEDILRTRQSILQFYLAEVECVHALCDRAGVPRIVKDSAMSMSQRVTILEGVYRGLLAKVGLPPKATIQ